MCYLYGIWLYFKFKASHKNIDQIWTPLVTIKYNTSNNYDTENFEFYIRSINIINIVNTKSNETKREMLIVNWLCYCTIVNGDYHIQMRACPQIKPF